MNIKRILSLIIAFMLAAVTFAGCGEVDESMGFIHVENGEIVNGNGEAVWLKGIALGNDVWSNPTEPVLTSHDESSFEDIASMGFNCVRFYLNYQLFEDDADPYNYKEEGFEWLDKNIKWAKKNGIGLIFNMHVPQGGYQSQGNGTGLWTDEESQNRLIALWAEIAKHYADEEAVIGYGVLNEPIVPDIGSVEASVDQCRDLMQRITDAIRKYDVNHIIFAERVCAVQDAQGNSDWNIELSKLQFLLDDDNTAYEFHCYSPHNFTHQDMDWAGTAGNVKTYPSDELMVSDVIDDWVDCASSKLVETLEDGWELYQTSPITLTDEYNVGTITLRAKGVGADGVAYFDDVIVEQYKDGELVKTVKELDFDSVAPALYFWAQNNEGKNYITPNGYSGKGYAISGTTADANVSGYKFELKEGYEYVIKAKVKKENVSSGASVMPRIDFSLAGNLMTLDKEYLESEIMANIQFGTANNVPMYMGEFGAANTACLYNRGGEKWVSDMLDICKELGVHFTYHAYHEGAFGLYSNSANELPANRNDKLAQVFIDKLTK